MEWREQIHNGLQFIGSWICKEKGVVYEAKNDVNNIVVSEIKLDKIETIIYWPITYISVFVS